MGVEIIGAIGLGLSAVGTAAQIFGQQKAQAQQKKQFEQSSALTAEANRKQQMVADLQSVRARRAAAREAQIRRADIQSGAEATGGGGSTSSIGAQGSVVTQGNSNISFIDQTSQLSSQASSLFGEASVIANTPIQQSGIPAGIASLGGTIFNNPEKFQSFGTIFNKP